MKELIFLSVYMDQAINNKVLYPVNTPLIIDSTDVETWEVV